MGEQTRKAHCELLRKADATLQPTTVDGLSQTQPSLSNLVPFGGTYTEEWCEHQLPKFRQYKNPNPKLNVTKPNQTWRSMRKMIFLLHFPRFLTKVYKENEAEAAAAPGEDERDFKHLTFALNAVFLKSGFVAVDPVTQNKIDGFRLPSSTDGSTDKEGNVNTTETVSLKFEIMKNRFNVCGYLTHNLASVYRVCLYKTLFSPSLNFACCYSGEDDASASIPFHVREVSKFWKLVKDRLVSPLHMYLSEITKLPCPPVFQDPSS